MIQTHGLKTKIVVGGAVVRFAWERRPRIARVISNGFLFALLVLWSLFLSWLAFRVNRNRIGIDDADIFFAYASNFAAGRGITYSPGIERVEGYTSTAWMLLSSAVFFLGLDEWGVLALNVLILATTLYVSLRLIGHFFRHSRDALVAKGIFLTFVSSSLGFVSWTTVTLMDTGLWILVVLGMAFPLVTNTTQRWAWIFSGVSFLIAPLARPEALLVAPVVLTALFFRRRAEGAPILGVAYLAVAFVSSAAGLTIFRLTYFGLPFPNTYYAKVSPSPLYNLSEGVAYLANFLIDTPAASAPLLVALLLFLMLVVPALSQRGGGQEKTFGLPSRNLFALVAVVLVLAAVPVAAGGDHFGLYRFFQPSILFLGVLVGVLGARSLSLLSMSMVSQEIRWPKKLSATALALVVFWLTAFGFIPNWVVAMAKGSPIANEFRISENGRNTGEQLNSVFGNDADVAPRIGVITAGGIARTYSGPIVDLMGLNNRDIALYPGDRVGMRNHAAFERDVFFELDVDLLVMSPFDNFANGVLKGLFFDGMFVSTWRYGTLSDQNSRASFDGLYSSIFLESQMVAENFVFTEKALFNEETQQWESVENQ